MYHLLSNWTAQRSAEQSEMCYLARIRRGEAKGTMDSTITTIEEKGHGTIPILWRLLAKPEKKLIVFTMSQ
jgi:hypothetical protein